MFAIDWMDARKIEHIANTTTTTTTMTTTTILVNVDCAVCVCLYVVDANLNVFKHRIMRYALILLATSIQTIHKSFQRLLSNIEF